MQFKKRPQTLAEISIIEISCDDCGRSRRWTRADVEGRDLPADATLDDLGNKLYCKTCRARGGLGFNIQIRCVGPLRMVG